MLLDRVLDDGVPASWSPAMRPTAAIRRCARGWSIVLALLAHAFLVVTRALATSGQPGNGAATNRPWLAPQLVTLAPTASSQSPTRPLPTPEQQVLEY